MSVTLTILSSSDIAHLEQVHQFYKNYAAWLGIEPSQENFDRELATLMGGDGPLPSRLLYAERDGLAAGCVGIRPLSDGVCELRRLYVSPSHRGFGVGRDLAMAAILAARQMGYRKILLDTQPNMRIAVKLYRELGFTEAPAYYPAPQEGTQFLALDLESESEKAANNEKLLHLFDFNRAWARQMSQVDPDYFEKLSHLQSPEYLWIGCSDSRVPANQIVGLMPGEVFVHRNIANVVVHTDLNCLSVIQFAVDVLRVKHIMVVGHYGCGGIGAALRHERVGLADLWLRHVQDVHVKHAACIDALPADLRQDRLCEINVLEQVTNVCRSIVIQDAWQRGQPLTIHGWIYGLKDGRIRDLGLTVSHPGEAQERYESALARLE